ncbi:MAG: hypothetical protein HOH27_06340 [Acidimicrobiaceae bacterium]|nr:hypothetical protein [Acidimicrobiaceae bacterium]
MNTQSPVAAASMLVSLAFAATVLERWFDRRRPQDLAWATSLGLFAAGAAALWWGASTGWSEGSFRAFYAFGAVLNVPILALGTVYLLASRRTADRIAVATMLACAFAAGVVMAAPLAGSPHGATEMFAADELPQGSEVFGAGPRVAAALASSVGALVVIVGSLWSMMRLGRIGGPAARRGATGNGLIVAGALVLSWGGLLNSVLDEMTGFAVSLLVGISLIFAGALTATESRSAAGSRPVTPPT